METWNQLLSSFSLVFLGEMGDKTQLLALVLAVRYKKPWSIMAGILVATLANHALAAGSGAWVASLVAPHILSWILAAIFFAFAIWILIPDKDQEGATTGRFGAFATTVVLFFLAEMGDKTQLATVALGAQYGSIWLVTLGTTLGMLLSNALAIFWGEKLLQRIPMKRIRIMASLLFMAFGLVILIQM